MRLPGQRLASMAGTASTVFEAVPIAFRYHVDDAANLANPGNLFALIPPSLFINEKMGASSITIHRTLTWSFGVPATTVGVVDDVVTATTFASGGLITAFAAIAKSTTTAIDSGDIVATHERNAAKREYANVIAAATTKVNAASTIQGPNDTERSATETAAQSAICTSTRWTTWARERASRETRMSTARRIAGGTRRTNNAKRTTTIPS